MLMWLDSGNCNAESDLRWRNGIVHVAGPMETFIHEGHVASVSLSLLAHRLRGSCITVTEFTFSYSDVCDHVNHH